MKRKKKTSIEEQESFIYLAPLEPDGKAVVYTTEPTMLKKMWEMYKNYSDDVTIKHDDEYGSEFYIPPTWICIKPKKKLTESQKKELTKRFNQHRKNPIKE